MPIKKIREFLAREGVRKYSANLSWLFFTRLITAVISFLATALVIRYLGPVEYGTLTFVIGLSGLFGFLVDVGLEKIISREFILAKHDQRDILGTSLVIRLIGSLLAFMASACVAFIYVNDVTIRILIIAASMSFMLSPFTAINSYFQSKSLSKFPSILAICVIIAISILKAWFAFHGAHVETFVFLTVFETILYSAGYLYIYARFSIGPRTPWKFRMELAKIFLKESWYLIFVSAFSVIFARIDQVIIQGLVGARQVGLYDAGVRIAESWHFIPIIITTALFPAVLGSLHLGEDIFRRRLAHLYRLIYVTALCIIIPIVLIAPWAVRILYGSEYADTVSIVQIYTWAGLFISISIVMQQHLVSVNKSKYLLISTSVGAIANIALNFILIPRIGIAGAAYATLISYALIPVSLLMPKATRNEASLMLESLVKYDRI